jgi:hypothetical protein
MPSRTLSLWVQIQLGVTDPLIPFRLVADSFPTRGSLLCVSRDVSDIGICERDSNTIIWLTYRPLYFEWKSLKTNFIRHACT